MIRHLKAAAVAALALTAWACAPLESPTTPLAGGAALRAVTGAVTGDAEARVTALRADPTTLGVSLATLDAGALRAVRPGASTELYLSPDLTLSARTLTSETNERGHLVWEGELEGGGYASLAVEGAQAVGTVLTPDGRLFRIQPVGRDINAVIEVDQSALVDDDLTSMPLGIVPPAVYYPPDAGTPGSNEGPIMVLVAFTPEAATAAGNIQLTITNIETNANTTFSNSNIPARIRIVDTMQVNYNNIGNDDFKRVVDNLAGRADGRMDEVHLRRDQVGADIVGLLVTAPSDGATVCGKAREIGANSDSAFFAMQVNCAGQLSFPHEIGHLAGCRHNTESDDDTEPFAYGHGLCVESTTPMAVTFRTLMGTSTDCSSGRVMQVSDPNINFNGVATGDTATRNCARVFRERAPTMAYWRERGGPACVVNDFGYVAGTWRVESHPRFFADVNGDDWDDAVGFGDDGVIVSLSLPGGFSAPALWLADFGVDQSWQVDRHVRLLGRLNDDDMLDIVGFGNAGVYTALSTGGSFGPINYVIPDLGYDAGWRIEDHPRTLADVDGDGLDDIVAFGQDGVTVAISLGDGTFKDPALWLQDLGKGQGWHVERNVRLLGDVNNDDRADIVAFGESGVYASVSNGQRFAPKEFVVAEFGYDDVWREPDTPRFLADVNADNRADIVGFARNGVVVSLATGGVGDEPPLSIDTSNPPPLSMGDAQGGQPNAFVGAGVASDVAIDDTDLQIALPGTLDAAAPPSFTRPALWYEEFGTQQGWRGVRHPRLLTDIDNDGRADIVGFGGEGVWTALASPTGDGFLDMTLWIENFGYDAGGWRMERHPRFAPDINGDDRADIAGMGDDCLMVRVNG